MNEKTVVGGNVPKLRFPEFRGGPAWKEMLLKNISSSIFDGTHQTPTYTEDGIPFFSVENIVSGNKNKFISIQDHITAKSKNKPEKGDILITRIGTIGFSTVVDWDYEFSIYVTLAVIKKTDFFNSYYLHSYFQSERYQSEIRGKSLLSAVPCKINMDELRKTEVLLPSPIEQQKIAVCLSSIDDLITAQTQKIDALKAHKKGLMQQLFPAEGETMPKLRFPEFRDAGEWEEKKINELTTYIDYRGKSPAKYEHGIFLVTAKNIKQGYIDYESSKEYVSPDEYDEVMKRGKPKIGDVLLTTEAPLGNVAQIDNENIALAQRVIKFRSNSLLYDDFLKYYMLGDRFQKLLESKAIGSTVLGIQGKVLHQLPINIPHKSEQQKIAVCLSSIDNLITAQTQKIDALKAHKKGLMQQLFPSADDGVM